MRAYAQLTVQPGTDVTGVVVGVVGGGAGGVPGELSQALPSASPSQFAWSALATDGQLSTFSWTPSPSESHVARVRWTVADCGWTGVPPYGFHTISCHGARPAASVEAKSPA